MVFVHVNEKILSIIGDKGLRQVQVVQANTKKYVKYADFKKIAKKCSQPIHQYVTRSDIIPQIQMNRIIQLSKRTPQQKRLIEQLKNKHERRLMDSKSKYNSNYYYYGNSSKGGNNVKQLTDSVSFGITFIFTFFMAGLTGYYFGIYFLKLQMAGSLFVSVIFIFVTIFVQTWLYIIKQGKATKQLLQKRKKDEIHSQQMAFNNMKPSFSGISSISQKIMNSKRKQQ